MAGNDVFLFPSALPGPNDVELNAEPTGGAATLTLAATEGADTANFSVALAPSLNLAATEGADTANFSIGLRQRVTLAAVEGADTASFSIGLRQNVTLAAVEGSDTAAFSVGLRQRLDLAAVEGADTASFTLDLVPFGGSSIDLAAVEGADTASFTLAVEAVENPVTPGFLTPEDYLRIIGRRKKRVRPEEEQAEALLKQIARRKTEQDTFDADALAQLQVLLIEAQNLSAELMQEAARIIAEARRRRDEDDALAMILIAALA
jgi:hypothetical protein